MLIYYLNLLQGSPLIGGYSYRKEFAPMGNKFFPLRVTPKFRNDIVSTMKVKNKYIFFYFSEGMENCKMSGKNQGKVREF